MTKTNIFIPLFGLIALLHLPLAAQGSDRGECQVFVFSQDDSPDWISSALYLSGDESLVIVDPAKGQVLEYSKEAQFRRVIDIPATKKIVDICRVEDQFVARLPGSETLVLDSKYRVTQQGTYGLMGEGKATGVNAVYDSVATDKYTFGFGAVNQQPEDATKKQRGYSLGFFEISTSVEFKPTSRAHMVKEVVDNSYYLLGLPYFAVDPGKSVAYFLVMEGRPQLYRYELGSQKSPEILDVLPSQLQEELPELPESTGPDTSRAIYGELERSSLPVGLYFHEGEIFILSREPVQGKTRWLLRSIDTEKQVVKGTLELPTRANHIELLPGNELWLLIEKGAVEKWGQQPVERLVTVPSVWLSNPDHSPLADSNGIDCRKASAEVEE